MSYAPPLPAATGLELVEKKVIGVDSTTTNFTGLAGNSVSCYVMFVQMAETLATNPSYYWQPNAIATNQTTQYVYTNVTTLGTAVQTRFYLAGIPATTGVGCSWTAVIYSNIITPRFYMSWSVERRSAVEPAIRAYGGQWDEQVTELTSILITSTQTGGIGAGSVLSLLKLA